MGQLTKQFGKIKVEVEIPHLLNLQVELLPEVHAGGTYGTSP